MSYEAQTAPTTSSRDPSDKHITPATRDIVFNKHSIQDGKHVSPSDNGMLQIGLDGIQVKMIKGIDTESFKRVVSMGLRATTGIDLNEPMDADEDTEEMLRGGLQQALESDRFVFAVTGVSRACTHQLVRTRQAAFLQQSQRATFFGNAAEVRIPESVWVHPNMEVLSSWLRAVEASRLAYAVATENDVSYQDARLVLPEGTTNSIVCSYTPREWLNTLAYRGCYMFQWEISHVFREMRKIVVAEYPWLEPHAKITCEKTGKCEFTGWESSEAQCPLPMARDDNRRVFSERYRIGGTIMTPLQALRHTLTFLRNDGATTVVARNLFEGMMQQLDSSSTTYDDKMLSEAIGKAIHAGDITRTDVEGVYGIPA